MAVTDAEQVPNVMSDEALNIFIAMPSVDNPNQRVCLQDAISAITNAILDLQSQITEVERRAALIDEAVSKMQTTFDTLAKALHTTTVQARGLMGPKPTGVN
jgi:hypothetical protein